MGTHVRSADRLRKVPGVPEGLLARKGRGAFFTPPPIAQFLSDWAIADNPRAKILDPTCGDGVFLLAAGERLRALGATHGQIGQQVAGVDSHLPSLERSQALLEEDELGGAQLIHSDFFNVETPAQIGSPVGWQDAVVGNPPFVRYQQFGAESRKRAASAALAQGVRLTGLASSWAPLLVHAAAFLKPEGRLAMVVPKELMTVSYAEPVRKWLRRRFSSVSLVMFGELQFEAEEQVILLVAQGTGSCDAFTLYEVGDAQDLVHKHIFDASSAALRDDGKWSDLILPNASRQLFRETASERFARLDTYGAVELGTVTGANKYFAISEATRRHWRLDERLLRPISPPGTRHLRGFEFTTTDWEHLRGAGQRVWLLSPAKNSRSRALASYVEFGEAEHFNETYKCSIRGDQWWCPPVVPRPDLFFTYMSHRYPRLIANQSPATILNSMHGVRLAPGMEYAKSALPLLCLNSVTMLGAEILGRSYGGGILKMEPREAAALPVPKPDDLQAAWSLAGAAMSELDIALRAGEWERVVTRVDEILLREVMLIPAESVCEIRAAAEFLRARRVPR